MGPQRRQASLKSAPNNTKGVASCNDNNCIDVAAGVPPGLRMPIVARVKVRAMAVTGAPNNLPILLDLPKNCANDAVDAKTAQLPHVSFLAITGKENGNDRGNACKAEDGEGVL